MIFVCVCVLFPPFDEKKKTKTKPTCPLKKKNLTYISFVRHVDPICQVRSVPVNRMRMKIVYDIDQIE